MSTPEQFGRFRFDGVKTSIKCSPAKFVVFESNTGPMSTLSFKANTQLFIWITEG